MRRTIYVYGMPGTRHALVRGLGVRPWLAAAPIVTTWTPRLRGWTVRADDSLGDLLALAEADGLDVRMRGTLDESVGVNR